MRAAPAAPGRALVSVHNDLTDMLCDIRRQLDEARQRLADIRAHLLGHVGWRGMAPDEKIVYPEHGDIRAFIRDHSFGNGPDTAQLLLPDLGDTAYISHSMSMAQLQFLFRDVLDRQLRHLLPAKSEEVTLMDIGSRLGAVLYAGYFMTDFGHLVGVEMEDYFCGLQRDVIKRFKLRPRVELLEELDLDTWVEPIEVEFPQALDEDSSDHHGSDDDDDDDEFVEEASSLHFYRVLG
ncbi:uncharacterized protein MONBRDRAFT_8479 [Monosiga brevicollis MX1]|uniref:DOT1 domain-containing protein n=1 Tax=Monosiga brevicollis TaxID=81824 RepID=A9V056_MONBE|nr:uncharacterized protein MONBRDRAFT_8479 [Monosiga brevicollis MX1]EDQ89098.1 predicted protein [Monosiga brevicollis MX1]|eukprot:XP_001746203.1 hypothetical protein [Monosiga brevicollis MX1]